MNGFFTTLLSLLLLVVGGIASAIMIARIGSRPAAQPASPRLRQAHRILGWVYVALFLVLFTTMLYRVPEQWEDWPPQVATHVALALALFVILVLKVLAARLPGLARHLFLLGAASYTVGFVLVWLTAGHYLTHAVRKTPYVSRTSLPTELRDPRLGMQLLFRRCSGCHILQLIMIPREARDWESIINRMVVYANSRIGADEAALILNYVSTTFAAPVSSAAGVSLLERHCSPCHRLETYRNRPHDREGWAEVVRRMTERAPDIVPEDKAAAIVDALEALQGGGRAGGGRGAVAGELPASR